VFIAWLTAHHPFTRGARLRALAGNSLDASPGALFKLAPIKTQ
jgi:hypothetical protein